MRKITISIECINKLIDSCEKAYPYEVCGVLLGNKDRISDIRILENLEEKKKARVFFSISPLEIYKQEKEAEKEALELIGFYHSHPDYEAFPSVEDAEHMIPGMVNLIVSLTKASYNSGSEAYKEKIRGYIKDSTGSAVKELIIQGE